MRFFFMSNTELKIKNLGEYQALRTHADFDSVIQTQTQFQTQWTRHNSRPQLAVVWLLSAL